MASFTIPLEGGGSMTVNASSRDAALGNVRSTGNVPAGTAPAPPRTAPAVAPIAAPAGGGAAGGGPVYMTANGPRTTQQMEAELRAVGWGGPIPGTEGPGAVANAYARTTGGAVTPSGAQPGSNPYVPGPASAELGGPGVGAYGGAGQGTNLEAARLAAEVANNSAQMAYYNSKLRLDSDDLAFRKAQQAWKETYEKASISGTFEGRPTLEAQKLNQDTALRYLQQIGQLRGPQDYGQYLRVLGSTPGGLRDLVQAAAGQYTPGRGATTGAATQAASLGGVLGQVGGQGTTYADFMQAGQNLPAPNQIAPQSFNAMTDTQRKVLMSMYESQGWAPQDVQDLYKQSLPTYAAPTTGTVKL